MINITKKTLIISSYAPPSPSGSGLMMYNIFSNFPKGSFCILTADENKEEALQKYKLDAPYYYYGNQLLSFDFNSKKETFLQRLKNIVKSFFVTKTLAELFLIIFVLFKIMRSGSRAIKDQNPDILLGFSDIGPCLLATYLLHKKYKLPFVLHFYDLYADNKLPPILSLVAKWLEPKLFSEAKKITVMCDEMKSYLRKKYKREDIEVIYNSINIPSQQANFPSPHLLKSKDFKIAYLGSIYWAQIGALRNLLSAVKIVKGIPIKVTLYTPHSKDFMNSLGIYENENIAFNTCTPDKVQEVLRGFDLLFLGLTFDSVWTQLINTSCPGRLCDFLVSGRPILIHAPQDSFLCKYGQKYQFAFVVSKNNVQDLAGTISDLFHNPNIGTEMAQKAINIAALNHNATINSELFSQIIAQNK